MINWETRATINRKLTTSQKKQVFLRLNNMEMKLLPNFSVSLYTTSAGGSFLPAESEEDV
jgi:hypothetical protein